jgi:hypothetical protein
MSAAWAARRGLPATVSVLCGILCGMLAGCAPAESRPVPGSPAGALAAPLATSFTTTSGAAWAIVAMGGTGDNRFWELFTRSRGTASWKLVTPPGVADNGGLIAAWEGDALTVSFRPSQGLTFSPLARTGDGGSRWGTGLLDAPIAGVPDALAAGGTVLVALTGDGAIDQATSGQGAWTALAAPGAVASTPAGARCQVTGLTAVAVAPAGTPLAGASCGQPGVAGIFARVAGRWQAAGPAVPAGAVVRVLRLARTSQGVTALLQAVSAGGTSLLAAWSRDGTQWRASPPRPLHGPVLASGTGASGAAWVLLPGDRAVTLAGPGAAWRDLPALPRATAALAFGPAGTTDALAPSGGRLTVYQLTAGSATAGTWVRGQAITVPIPYGSSG